MLADADILTLLAKAANVIFVLWLCFCILISIIEFHGCVPQNEIQKTSFDCMLFFVTILLIALLLFLNHMSRQATSIVGG